MPIRRYEDRCRASRKAIDLLHGLTQEKIEPSSVTDVEQVALRLHGKRMLKKQHAKIKRLRARSERLARREQRSLLRSPAIRLFAAYVAIKKAHKQQQSSNPLVGLPPFAEAWSIASALNRLSVKAPAVQFSKKKAKGGYRTLHQFFVLGKAKQELALYALKPFASSHTFDFEYACGQLAACEKLLRDMNNAPPGTRFMQFDIRDFYPSISLGWLRSNLPLSPEVIDSVIALHGYNITSRDKELVRPHRAGEVNLGGQRGIPQGSAVSPFVAGMVMIEVLRSAASVLRGLKVYGHSDNVGVLVPPHIDTTVLEQSLSDAFTTHPAGPFTLTTSGAQMLSRPFRFLGYDFVKPLGRPARANAPDAEAREAVYYADMLDAKSMADLVKVREEFVGYCAAFRLSEEVREMRERLTDRFSAEVLYRQRVSQERIGQLVA